MIFTAPSYDGYNSRYCRNEIKIWKYIFREYLQNQKRYDMGLFSKNDKNDHQDLTRRELPRAEKGGGSRTTFPYFLMLMLMVFTATFYDAYNSRYRNTEMES